jgi:hypothetical protein
MRWCVVVPLVAACGGGDAGRHWGGAVDTLPGGAIRVTNPSEGMWRDDAAWRLVSTLVIGEAEGAEATTFAAVSGLLVDEGGRIYILDRQANELRIFAPDGTLLRSVGRSGGGPGEYRNANGLVWLAPDTLVVVDQRGDRYTMLTREGEYVRSVARALGFFGWVFSGAIHDGRIYEQYYAGTDPAWRPVLLGTALRGDSTAAMGKDTVWLPARSAPIYEGFSIRTARGGMGMSVPFAPGLVYHVDRAGGIWFGHGSAFHVFRAAFTGDTIMEVLLEATPAPVAPAELAAWEAGAAVKRFREMGGRIDMDRIPKAKPFFEGLTVDPAGYLWVTVPAGPMEIGFRVFDPEGRYLGRLGVSGIEPDRYVPPVVRDGRVYLVGRDAVDVQRVHVFTIVR